VYGRVWKAVESKARKIRIAKTRKKRRNKRKER